MKSKCLCGAEDHEPTYAYTDGYEDLIGSCVSQFWFCPNCPVDPELLKKAHVLGKRNSEALRED